MSRELDGVDIGRLCGEAERRFDATRELRYTLDSLTGFLRELSGTRKDAVIYAIDRHDYMLSDDWETGRC